MIRLSRTDDLTRRRLIVVAAAVTLLLTSLGAYSLLVHGGAEPDVAPTVLAALVWRVRPPPR